MWLWALLPVCLALYGTVGIWAVTEHWITELFPSRTVLVFAMAALANTGFPSEAAVCEWALVMLFFCLFGLFAAEFRHIDCHRLTVQKQALGSDCRSTTIEINGYVANTLS